MSGGDDCAVQPVQQRAPTRTSPCSLLLVGVKERRPEPHWKPLAEHSRLFCSLGSRRQHGTTAPHGAVHLPNTVGEEETVHCVGGVTEFWIDLIRQQSWFCRPQGQLPPIRNYLHLYRLKSSEDTFISGLKGYFLRNKQTPSNMAFNSCPRSRQDGAKKPSTASPGSQEPLTKQKQRPFEEYGLDLEGFQMA